MADTTRPRPRPRPRPLVKSSSVTTDGPSTTPGASSSSNTTRPLASSSSPGKRRVIQVNDTDEMFMRNTHRTYETWQRLDRIDKQISKVEKAASSDGDSDNATPSHRNYKKKKVKQELPLWQKSKQMSRLLSQDLSEHDSDDDVEILGESSPNAKSSGKRKRQERSRSRSITPPPSVPFHQIQTAKNLVRQALNINPRPPSPSFDPDESTDTIILLPELRAIAQEIKDKPYLYSSPAPEAAVAAVAGSGEHIVINVTWHPHPKALQAQKQDWQYRIDRSESFRELFEAVAEDAGIPSANVVMTYQNNRFFPSITPTTLKIWSDSANLDAYEQTTWKYMQENQDTSRFGASQGATTARINTSLNTTGPIEIDSDSDNDDIQVLGTTFTGPSKFTSGPTAASPSPPPTYTQPNEFDAESEVEGGKFKLILRSSLTSKDITLTVRTTTKCGAIVKAFLKKAGVADNYPEVFTNAPAAAAPEPKKKGKGGRKSKGATGNATLVKDPRLCIDGDKMDNATEIGEMDLEDGDMVEVVGL